MSVDQPKVSFAPGSSEGTNVAAPAGPPPGTAGAKTGGCR
jgi:hypothetical protein